MAAVNVYIAIGNVTRNPDLRHLPNGTAACKFGIAINRQYRDKAGEKKERTTFVECEAWNKLAEVIAEHIKKGDPIYVEGWLENDDWEDERGKHHVTFCRVNNFQFLNGRKDRPETPPDEKEPNGDYKF